MAGQIESNDKSVVQLAAPADDNNFPSRAMSIACGTCRWPVDVPFV